MQNTIRGRKREKELFGMLFVLPTVLVLFLFVVYPISYTAILSFCDYNFAFYKRPKFNVFNNFLATVKDIQFFRALSLTLVFTLMMFTLLFVLSLSFEWLLFY